jgi:GH25 family lysozyme M1 (1,4-beta-N-acetylmuramidase)
MKRLYCLIFLGLLTGTTFAGVANSGEFLEPWKDNRIAIVIDTFEGNSIDWDKLATDPRVAGIIHRATIGYRKDKEYFNRKEEATKRGYKWGSYHLGVAGDPVKQADFYLETVKPEEDEVIALDLESLESNKYMSLDQARVFIKRIKEKTGRYPMLYANYKVVTQISTVTGKEDLFSKTALWYARFRNQVTDFPTGTWDSYTLWQFSCEINCKPTQLNSCAYLVPGTETDMDINVFNGTVDDLKEKWPFGE